MGLALGHEALQNGASEKCPPGESAQAQPSQRDHAEDREVEGVSPNEWAENSIEPSGGVSLTHQKQDEHHTQRFR